MFPGKVCQLGKRQLKIPSVELPLLRTVKHVQVPVSPEHHLVGQHLFLRYSGVQAVIDQLLRQRAGFGKRQFFVQREGLFPGLSGHSDRVAACQQLHALDWFRRGGDFRSLRHTGLRHSRCAHTHHQLPGGYRPGVHEPGQALDADAPLLRPFGQIPLHLEGYPAVDAPLLAAILRRIENPDHHPAGKGDAVAAPFFPPEDGLSPCGKDSADVRHSVGQLDLLGLLHILNLPQHRFHAGAGGFLKLKFQVGSLLIPRCRYSLFNAGQVYDKRMSSSSHNAKTERQKRDSAAAADEPAGNTMPHDQPQSEEQAAAPMQVVFPAHKNTPCLSYAGGVQFLTAEVGLLHRVGAGKLRAGAA